MIYNLYKPRGETPLQTIERFRETFSEHANTKMTYLGRLDPMADGVLLVGTGEPARHASQCDAGGDTSEEVRQKYFGLDKEYDFTVLFGFATDTYDCLGKIVNVESDVGVSGLDLIKISKVFEGERDQKYPKYSSKMIDNPNIDPPTKIINIYNLQFKKLERISGKELFGRLLMDIGKVKGDFRQADILEGWKEVLLDKNDNKDYHLGFFSAHVSSGTYIRSLVNDFGNTLSVGACALSITRTRLGNFDLKDSIKF